ncbi:MAG: hypothetical protein WEB57_08255 [Pseudohongiellaceae bacterium]
MDLKCYLVVQGKKPKYGFHRETRREPGTIRVAKNKPNTQADEIAIRLDIQIPDSLFIKPMLQVGVAVPDWPQSGEAVTAEVRDDIAQIIQERTGLAVRISADPDEEPNSDPLGEALNSDDGVYRP